MKVNNVIQAIQSNLILKRDLKNKNQATNAVSGDTVSISSEARNLQKINNGTQNEEMNEVSKVQQDKIDMARQRISEGYYSSQKVLSQIADELLRYFNI